jgi:hypothetical protein
MTDCGREKSPQSFRGIKPDLKGGLHMRMTKPTFIALTALAVLATPVFAKTTKAQKTESEGTESTSPPCSSYQLGAGGNWEQLPCQEVGTHSSSQHRAPARTRDEEAR